MGKPKTGLNSGLMAKALLFGMVAAIPAIIVEASGEAGLFFVTLASTSDVLLILAAVIFAPVAEESLKPLGLYLAKFENGVGLTLKQWAILGLLAGLGFKILEDLLYVFVYNGPSYGGYGMLATALMRAPVPTHLIASMTVGFGIGLWSQTGKARYFGIALALAILLHALFNLSVSI